MRDFIGSGISDEGVNKNVINILRVVLEDEDSVLYVPYSYVADRGEKSKDPRVHFPPKESGRPMQVVDIVGNQERFNFSLQCLVDVKVEYEKDGSKYLEDKKVWRNYHVIRDGELIINKMAAKLSESSYSDLRNAGVLYSGDTLIDASYIYNPDGVYTISLENIPLVSSNWARPNALNFHKMLRDGERANNQLKQIKKILKESGKSDTSELRSDVYTEEISSYGSSSKDKSVECVTYSIIENPGYKVPKYEGVAESDIKAVKNEVKDCRFKCACIKWAIESAMSHRKSPYNWSEEYQKKAGSPKYYSETLVEIDGVSYRLERCRFTKMV